MGNEESNFCDTGVTSIKLLGTRDFFTGQLYKTFKKTVNVTGTSSSEAVIQTIRTLDFSTDVADGAIVASIEVTASFGKATNIQGLKPICLSLELTDNQGTTIVIFANKVFDEEVLF